MKYRVMASVSIYPQPEGADNAPIVSGNSLYHQQTFDLTGERFADIAPTIDRMYDAIAKAVSDGNSH